MSHFISFVRIPALAIRSAIRPLPKLGIFEEDMLEMRVWPQDIDINFHMNNARYLTVMDYTRLHHLARTRLLGPIVAARWQAMVGAVWMTYRRSLPLLARYSVATRMVCWDDRWFYFEQTFTGAQGLAALGWIKGVLRSREGIIEPQRLIDGVAPGTLSPEMPEAIANWNELTREKLQAGS